MKDLTITSVIKVYEYDELNDSRPCHYWMTAIEATRAQLCTLLALSR